MNLMLFFGGLTQQHYGTIFVCAPQECIQNCLTVSFVPSFWDFIYDMQWENDAKDPRESVPILKIAASSLE